MMTKAVLADNNIAHDGADAADQLYSDIFKIFITMI